MKNRTGVSMMVAIAAGAFGCQLLYDKNDLTVSTGGAAGNPGTTTTGGTSTTSGGGTTTATGGMGGAGGSVGGSAGATSAGGGGATSSGGAAGAGGLGGSGGLGGGGTAGSGGTGGTTTSSTCDDALFAFASSAASVMCATFTEMNGWTVSTSAAGNSATRPAAVLTAPQDGVGVFYQGGASGPLRAVVLSGGACGAPADVLAITTKAAPSATVIGGQAHVLFQGAVGAGTDHPFVTTWDAAAMWTPPDQIDMNVFSPSVAGLGASGAELLAVYGGGDDNLYRVRKAGGAWQLPASCFKDGAQICEQANKAISPAVLGLATGWLVVFQEKVSLTALRWLTGDGSANVPSQKINGASSASPVSLARTAKGAVLGFRGLDEKVYATTFDAGAAMWGPIQQVGTGMTSTSPAVAGGVCTHEAELVYIDKGDGSVRHASLEAGIWSVPDTVGGTGMMGVALAGPP